MRGKRRLVPILAAPVAALLLASGVALAATVRCDGEGTCFGTKRDDLMVGTEGRDIMGALAGEDATFGKAGADRIDGGLGDDELRGGAGRDYLAGEGSGFFAGGNDVLRGGRGDDSLQGGYGAETLHGGRGDDFLSVDGQETPARLYCGEGHDRYDVRGRGAGEDSGDVVFVAEDCEEEVDIPSTF